MSKNLQANYRRGLKRLSRNELSAALPLDVRKALGFPVTPPIFWRLRLKIARRGLQKGS
jgi:hypothetical protein